MGVLTPSALRELLGAPLRAMVEAEAMAARATADFIREVGFVPASGASSGSAAVDNYGSPRMVSFRYSRTETNGTSTETTISVPMLTLIPIPSLQISEASIDLSLILTESKRSDASGRTQLSGIIASPIIRSAVARADQSGGSGRLTMDVSIRLTQSDLTHGMVALLNQLGEGVSDTRRNPGP